jgi:hypothetical protein
MAFDWFSLFKPIVGPALDKLLDLIPNKNERERAKEEFEKKMLEAIVSADNAQAEINKVEAGSQSLFVAGWRPWVGWVCGCGLAWSFVLSPFLAWGIAVAVIFWKPELKELPALPELDTGQLLSLTLAMLGIGGLRTFEKVKGVARNISPTAKP